MARGAVFSKANVILVGFDQDEEPGGRETEAVTQNVSASEWRLVVFLSVPTHEFVRRRAAIILSVILAGCAQLSAGPSSRYDGQYELTSTAAAGLAQYCPSQTLNVIVADGRLDFTVHPPDAWHGFIDANGYFHGESGLGAREFKLLDGFSVPDVVGNGSYPECQYRYRFKPVRNGANAHS